MRTITKICLFLGFLSLMSALFLIVGGYLINWGNSLIPSVNGASPFLSGTPLINDGLIIVGVLVTAFVSVVAILAYRTFHRTNDDYGLSY